jgi:AcrR family transcriptional regulator
MLGMSKGAETRQQIVSTALDRAAVVGLEGLTLGALAGELRLSKSGLYAHFRSKEALQLAVLGEAIRRFSELVLQPALEAPRGEPRVLVLIERWLEWFRSEIGGVGCVFLSLAAEFDDRPGAVRDAVVASQKAWVDFLAGAAERAVAEGHFRPDLDPRQFAFEFSAISMSLQFASKLFRDPAALERARSAFDALIERSRREPASH